MVQLNQDISSRPITEVKQPWSMVYDYPLEGYNTRPVLEKPSMPKSKTGVQVPRQNGCVLVPDAGLLRLPPTAPPQKKILLPYSMPT